MTEAEHSDDADLARLEAAFARIAHAGRARPAQADAGAGSEQARARLDALIGEVRAALGRDSPE